MTTRALLTVFAFVASTNLLHAQSNVQCDGPGGRAPFKVAVVGSGSMQGGGPGGRAPIDRLQSFCAPQSPDFVGEDSKVLLTKIKLAKTQNDSSKALLKSFAARQKTVTEQRRNADAAERQQTDNAIEKMSDQQVRQMYLTPEVVALRKQFAAALRAVLTAEQTAQFDLNVAALNTKDSRS